MNWGAIKESRHLPLFGVFALAYLLLNKLGTSLDNPDTYFHLAMGKKWATGEWSITDPGHFSAYENGDWSPTQWLSQILFYELVGVGQGKLLLLFCGALLLVTLGYLYYSLSHWCNPWVALILTGATTYSLLPFAVARPMILSTLFGAFIVVALSRGWQKIPLRIGL